MSSATASALRPGARSTGMPRAVAAATSTLLGSPRHEPIGDEGEVEDGALHRVGLDDEHVRAFGLDALGELLRVVDAQWLLFDPRVVDDVGEALERVEPFTAERRRDERLGSIGHAASSRLRLGVLLGRRFVFHEVGTVLGVRR